jgi:hypothetical protein|tara:strand:+ start:734 stop:901 length:168 start_codon:yes stop_codon:yes gene_type:complete
MDFFFVFKTLLWDGEGAPQALASFSAQMLSLDMDAVAPAFLMDLGLSVIRLGALL